MATAPLALGVTAVMVRVSPGSGSVSLANTLIGLAPESSSTVAVSLTASGASLSVLAMLMVTVATLLVSPAASVTV